MVTEATCYNVEALSRLSGLGRRTVSRRLHGVAYRVEGRSRLYRAGDAFPALVASEAEPGTVSLVEAQTRRFRAQAEKLRLEIDAAKKRLIPVEQVRCKAERGAAAASAVARRWAGKLTAGEVENIVSEFEALGKWPAEFSRERAP